ncbi:hypothetical protein BABINDRAFT_170707 [Babjeviella inositovora NRRL Y-12698]|uniref:Uncharacterized protein n=1 Tax=Babjeviella inositovora NRRL Y-12698 TaxID=984486 RepID=A0A1E3QTG5_9ASCO|nr:uncharacterized protein BABINDRAFT_170707 [Babjeviella inositovora NRRL Y-12698]ODQ80996.1 hypothetical protein BABINDRAFT_170707 [Babjeviella inositovora NRRL Y-12698]
MSVVIGIAFGNTSSSIAVATSDGKVDVIANPDGDRSIPSALSYVGADEYHGQQAVNQLVRNASSTIVNFRDFIGVPFAELPASAFSEISSKPLNYNGQVGYKIDGSDVSIQEVTKRHLKQVKLAAEDYIGKTVEGVVMTVPTNFSDVQKAELKKVSADSGLPILQFINEPSAALLAHLSVDDKLLQDRTYVVADFGGVRSDAAVIAVRGGILTILATAHDLNLGGDSLDNALADFFAADFKKKYQANPKSNPRSLAKLKAACIITKKTLSNVQTSTISIDSLADGYDYHTTINRLRYELVARDVLSKMAAFTESVVLRAGLETLDIDEVLLVGGTSHTPKLASNVAFIFPESAVVVAPSLDTKAINPAELIARGAALQASMVESFDEAEINESLAPVVVNTQHIQKSIGLAGADGSFLPILLAETAFPIRKAVQVTASGDVLIALHEGERSIKETVLEAEVYSDDEEAYSDEEPEVRRDVVYVPGTKLAELALKGVSAKVEVVVNITRDGTLTVSAREVKTGAVAVKCETKFA